MMEILKFVDILNDNFLLININEIALNSRIGTLLSLCKTNISNLIRHPNYDFFINLHIFYYD